MPPTSDLDPVGQVFERLFIRAWDLFDDDKYNDAYDIGRMLLREPRLGRLHRAGLHMMLGQSPDQNYSWHADEAVKLYENMYDADETPSPEQAEGIRDLLADAKRVEANARGDDERFEASLPIEQVEREWQEQQVMAADEEFQNGDSDIENEDDFHDDMLSDDSDEAEVHHGDPEETTPPVAEEVEGVEDVEMAEQQSVAQQVPLVGAEDFGVAEDDAPEKRPRMSAADRQIIAEGAASMGASGLATPAATRTATGNTAPGGASRRSSRRKSGN